MRETRQAGNCRIVFNDGKVIDGALTIYQVTETLVLIGVKTDDGKKEIYPISALAKIVPEDQGDW